MSDRGSTDIVYPRVDDALLVYARLFSCTTQQAADQLRSREALEGALTRPQWYAHYEASDVASQAAVLAHGIAETQPFVEGNKRTALGVMLVFLAANGYTVSASQQERADWMLSLSEGMRVGELAGRIRDCLVVSG